MTALPGKPAANATPVNESGVERLAASSPGARLQKGREAAKLDVSQVADALHLSQGVVKALEADDYRALPNATFVKGYIRSYARLVGVPGEELVRSYETIAGGSKQKSPEPIQAPLTTPRFGVPLKIGAILAVVLMLVFVFWPGSASDLQEPLEQAVSEQAGLETTSPKLSVDDGLDDEAAAIADSELESLAQDSQEPEPEDAPETELVEPVTPGSDASSVLDVERPTAEIASIQAPQAVVETVAPPVEPVEEQPSAVASAASGRLSMVFSGDCWVEVRDGTGQLIYSNLKRLGESLTLSGVPPFEAKFGNGNVVSLSYNGQPVSFHTPSHNVVRVRLGE